MSRFKAALNAKEKRELFDPQGTFANNHPGGFKWLYALMEAQFHISEVVRHEHHCSIRLGCGAVLSVYKKGKVMVQGRLHGLGSTESKEMLEELLPRNTIWQVRLVD